jgi:hypothetical protein
MGVLSIDFTTHNTPLHIILSTAPQLSISQKALRTLPEDDNVYRNTYELPYIINKLNEYLVYLLVYHAYVNEMHGSRSKIPSKKSRQAALREGIYSGVKGLTKKPRATKHSDRHTVSLITYTVKIVARILGLSF